MADLSGDELAAAGVSAADVERQLELFRNPPGFASLTRHCALGDGIEAVEADREADYFAAFERARAGGRLSKFVPASGAASRMFQALLAMREVECTQDVLADLIEKGDGNARIVAAFVNGVDSLPFFPALREECARRGDDLDAALDRGDLSTVVAALVDAAGMGCGEMPKGLLPFHRYADETRTAFEEHLREAVDLIRDDAGLVRCHFTVSEEHLEDFKVALDAARARIETGGGATRLDVSFSTQARTSDTIAVGLDNQPFRAADGSLIFRPGGHGALLENLGACGADIALIQNIDNIQPADRRAPSVRWKKLLIGRLVLLEEQRTAAVESVDENTLRDLCGVLGVDHCNRTGAKLSALVDRPLRVSGVVPNTGEPGGGPFWLRGADGRETRQIVESAQVDMSDEKQAEIFRSATHFNPVLLACSMRDCRGESFRLADFVDERAVFIVRKSFQGSDLKALERPGLWNGAMAAWGSVFLEIGNEAFTPVKTVADLLRREHQTGF